jgi:von Willebrand factor type A domain
MPITQPDRPREPSPLRDVRALGASAAFHVAILALASIAALGVHTPFTTAPPKVLNAEIGPVDNRVPKDEGGGAAGELGGTSEALRISTESRASRGKAALDGVADRLLADAPPPPVDSPRATEKAPPGPSTTGLGLLQGAGPGGGGGSGGGSGGGVGKGIGPGTEFFGAQDRASSFAYVIDCSGSMSNRGALRIAKAELLNSLDRLPPDAMFTVVFYSVRATVFPDANGMPALMPATRDNKARLRTRLNAIHPDGGTDHGVALRAAIATKPEVIFFLTDAERMEVDDAKALRDEAGAIRIQAIEFGDGPVSGATSPLRDLATGTGGTFRHIDLSAPSSPKP